MVEAKDVVYGLSTLRVVARYVLHRLRLGVSQSNRAQARGLTQGRDDPRAH